MPKSTKGKPKASRRKGSSDESSHTVAKRYRLPKDVVLTIRKAGPAYGSQGRALQVATELLVRMKRPIKLRADLRKANHAAAMTYKLVPRTVELIDALSKVYGKRGNVLQACAEILRQKPPVPGRN